MTKCPNPAGHSKAIFLQILLGLLESLKPTWAPQRRRTAKCHVGPVMLLSRWSFPSHLKSPLPPYTDTPDASDRQHAQTTQISQCNLQVLMSSRHKPHGTSKKSSIHQKLHCTFANWLSRREAYTTVTVLVQYMTTFDIKPAASTTCSKCSSPPCKETLTGLRGDSDTTAPL